MNFTMHRDRTIASTCGRAIEFKKGVPTHVPPAMHADVIAAGGIPEEELPDDEMKELKPPQGEEREKAIAEAMEKMLGRNDRDDFTAGGAPHIKKLSELLGFSVDAKERDVAWAKLQAGED